MSWFLDQRAEQSQDTPALSMPAPAPGRVMGAAFTSQWIEDDAWSRGSVRMNEVRDQIIGRLGDRAPTMAQVIGSREAAGWDNIDRLYTQRVVEAAAALAAENPGEWAGVPLSVDDFEAEVIRRRQSEFEEAQAVLAMGGGGPSEFLGRMAGAMTDPVTLATLPMGAGSLRAGGRLAFIGTEAALGAASEAAILPRAYRSAEELDLPDVDPAQRILMGAAGGAALSGAIVGGAAAVQRALAYSRDRNVALGAARPEGVPGADFATAVEAVELDLRAGRRAGMTPTERIATQQDALQMDAPTLLATTGGDGAMRAIIRLPDGTRLSGLEVGATLPDGGRIAGIEAGRLTIERDGVSSTFETGQALGAPGAAAAPEPAPVGQMIDERPGSAASRFVFTPGGNAEPATNPVGYTFGRLMELGYEPRVAAALVGNLMQESGPALNTRAVGDNGNAYGMGQWNGPRRRALYSWAEARGLDVNDIETQVQFLHHELQGPENAALRAILAAPDAASAARVASERFWRPGIPHLENRMGYAADLQRQFEAGEVPRGGRPAPVAPQPAAGWFDADAPAGPGTGTRRSTAPDEVSGPQGTRTGVRWEVVETDSLRAASGELQPRDRSRAASDEQIARIAADLDPARLMPGPEADRGAPIVGPDSIVESGNGRVAAISRAAEQNPERYRNYVETLREQGYPVEGMRRPVLIGRRTGDMTPEQRVSWVRENNTSAIARMGGAEQARMDAGYLTQPVMDALRPGADLAGAENGNFLRRLFAAMPQTERAALMTGDGRVTVDGIRRVRSALFSRAWGDDALARLLLEKPSDELRALVGMLEDLAPEWAAFRGMVDAGYIRPDYDITERVTGMVRLIGEQRAADRSGQSVVAALRDYLATGDLLTVRDPAMDRALLDLFYPGTTARRPAAAGDILRRYAAEAAIVGRADQGDLLTGTLPEPHQVLSRATAAQNSGEAMPPAPAAPARVAPDPVQPDARADLPEAPEGAASPQLETLARATEVEARAALDAPARAADEVVVDAADYLALRDVSFRMSPDGPEVTLRSMLDDLDADAALEDAIRTCAIGGTR